MRMRFAAKFMLTAIIILLGCMLPSLGEQAEAAQERYQSDVKFEFKYEEEAARVIPQVRVTKIYFDDGRVETNLHEFPEQAWPVSKEAQSSDRENIKDDPSLKKRFFPRCGWSVGTHVLETDTGPRAFTVYCDSTVDKKVNPKIDKEAINNYVLYGYDIEKNRLSVIHHAQKHWGDPSQLDFYFDFGGYAIRDGGNETDYNKRQVRVYSLISNKLLARTTDYPRQSEDGKTLIYTDYKKISGDPKVLAQVQNYNGYNGEHFLTETMVLKADGTRTKQEGYKELPDNILAQEKIGAITYILYKNPKNENRMVGYRASANAALKPLSRAEASSMMRFTKSKRFMLIHQQTDKEKTIRIIDTATAKVVSEFPDIGGGFFEEVGDAIALFRFEKKDYYIHLPTGIITRNMENSQLITKRTGKYIGDQSKLISMQVPPQMYVNGNPVKFAGQGPFLTIDNRWYVEVNDFSKAADATVTRNASGLTITRGAYTMTVSKTDKTALRWAGQTFVPLETLNAKLGMAGGFVHPILGGGYESQSLSVFSKDLKEADVMARPDLYEAIENSPQRMDNNYYAMQGGKPAAKSLSETSTYQFRNSTKLIFKDGALVNLAAIHTAGGRTLRNIIFDIDKFTQVMKVYGTPKATRTGGKMIRWYEIEGKIFVVESSNNNVASAYYVIN